MKLSTILGCLIAAVCGHHPAHADGIVTVIRAGHLIDTESGRMLDAQTIVVRGGIIGDVGPSIAAPPGRGLWTWRHTRFYRG